MTQAKTDRQGMTGQIIEWLAMLTDKEAELFYANSGGFVSGLKYNHAAQADEKLDQAHKTKTKQAL